MSLTYSSKGTPVMNIGKYSITLTSSGNIKDMWKWITISSGGKKDIAPFSLKGLKTKIVPIKVRNRIGKVIKKYVRDDGFIYKEDVESLYNDLSGILGESVSVHINNLLELLK